MRLSDTATLGLVASLVLLAPSGARAQEASELEVKAIAFEGVAAIDASDLEAVLATKASSRLSFLPWIRKRFFDRDRFEADLERIRAFYVDRGYPDARVVAFDLQRNDAETAIRVTIRVEEGEPLIVARVAFEGFEALPPDDRAALDALPVRVGDVFRRVALKATADTAARRLHDAGYAYARVEARDRIDREQSTVDVTLTATPGPRSVFGPVQIAGNHTVDDAVVRRQISFQPGEAFRLGELLDAQRRLYDLQLFRYVNVEPRLSAEQTTDIPVRVTLSEAKPREIEFAVGYGSEEQARGEVTWRHRNFFGGARGATLEGKWSSLDRGVRAGFTQPAFLTRRQTLAINGQRWFADEPAYELDTSGGRLSVSIDLGRRDALRRRGATTTVTGSVISEFERFAISSAALEDLSFRDELIALGLDPRTGLGRGTLAALAFDLRRGTIDNLLDARQGYVVSVHLEQAGSWLPGNYNYVELSGEARHYWTTGLAVVANRARAGTLTARGELARNVPFFKRYFLGGSNGLRGWGRFEVAPLSGSGLPLGGHSFLEVTSELRVPVWGKLGAVGFVDAGNAWSGSWQVVPRELRADVGAGLRYDTPVGPVRLDLAYQLTRIADLLVNGKPESRPWRIHVSIGQAF